MVPYIILGKYLYIVSMNYFFPNKTLLKTIIVLIFIFITLDKHQAMKKSYL